jgi:hypothetical protein
MPPRAEKIARGTRPIRFPHWEAILTRSTLPALLKEDYRNQISSFMSQRGAGPDSTSIDSIQEYLAGLPEDRADGARHALRWYVRMARIGHRR